MIQQEEMFNGLYETDVLEPQIGALHAPAPRTLIPKKEVKSQVRSLAIQLGEYQKEFADQGDLVLVAVLTGGVYFATDIDRLLGKGRLGFKTTMHYLQVARSSRSARGDASDAKQLLRTFRVSDIQGRNVILIDDIVESGTTLRAAYDLIQSYGPNSIETVSLLWKPKQTLGNFRPNWCCFQINDVFVSGYGMDDQDGLYRNLQRVVYWPDRDTQGEYTPLKPYRLD